jgi:ElaA protein
MLTWRWLKFNELTTTQLYDILALRQEVFVVEQHCPYNDIDYHDQDALHLLGTSNGNLVAYLRLLPMGLPYPNAISFGRVLTSKAMRKQSLGKALMQETLHYLQKTKSAKPIIISAQLYLRKFYERYGFTAIDQEYDEDGIPHIKMIKLHE